MGIFRQELVTYWSDNFTLSLPLEGKLLYKYLLTNSKTTQCGIYEFSKEVIKFETKLSDKWIDEILNILVSKRKILISKDTEEIMILNWIKYNSVKSPKVWACVEKELKNVKHKPFADLFLNLVKQQQEGIEGFEINYQGDEEYIGDPGEVSEKKITKKEAKFLKSVEGKLPCAEYVYMTQDEVNKLREKYGEENFKKLIEILNNHKASKAGGKYLYESDYHAILKWVVDSLSEKLRKEGKTLGTAQGHNGKAEDQKWGDLSRNTVTGSKPKPTDDDPEIL